LLGDYRIDPSLAGTVNAMASAPDGHPRRCQAKSRATQQQCKNWATKGRHYCRFHGGHLPYHKEKKLAGLYSRRANKRLKELLTDAANAERNSLAEEVDVARVLAARAMKSFEKICIEDPPTELAADKAKLGRLRATATASLRTALSQVASLVTAHSKVISEQALDAHAAEYVVAQVVKILQERIEDEELLNALVTDLEELKVPSKTTVVVVE